MKQISLFLPFEQLLDAILARLTLLFLLLASSFYPLRN
ncbi:MAG: hypothetical protein ACI9BJ_000966, partial [Flavobacteriales bacterium]